MGDDGFDEITRTERGVRAVEPFHNRRELVEAMDPQVLEDADSCEPSASRNSTLASVVRSTDASRASFRIASVTSRGAASFLSSSVGGATTFPRA